VRFDRESHRVAVCCSVLQCVAVCCSVLQCVAAICRGPRPRRSEGGSRERVLVVIEGVRFDRYRQCVAVCCSQCVAVYCSAL